MHAVHHKIRKPETARNTGRPNKNPKTSNKAFRACCGHHDKPTECPAKGKQCLKCRKFNHFAKACNTKSHTPNRKEHRAVHAVEKYNEDFESELFVDTVTAEEEDEDSVYADIGQGQENVKLMFKLETRAHRVWYLQKILLSSRPAHYC